MNAQGISGNNGWAQFVKLTNDARVRNQGLTSQATRANVVANREIKKQTPTAQFPVMRNANFAAGKPEIKQRILGGNFDAYA